MTVDAVDVRWPSGTTDHWTGLAAGTGYLLREGQSTPLPLPGFAAGQGHKPRLNPR